MYKVAVSVICYDNEKEVLEFAKKLSEQKKSEKIILLVTCNKCSDVKRLKSELNCIKISSMVFDPQVNLGYLHGCLFGLEEFGEEYDYAVISNTDIDFVTYDFFEKLITNDYNRKIGCIGPDIVLKETGKHQNPFSIYRPDKKLMKLRKLVYDNYFLYNLYFMLSKIKNNISKGEIQQKKGYVYSVHGSVFILKKECIDKFLKDNIQIFMYGEELYVAEKLKENQMLLYYDNDLKIIHNENQVTGKIASRRKQEWFSQSTKFLVDRFWK